MSYLEASEIQKSFRKGASLIEVLKGVNLCVEKGDYISVVGASGAGKSTLLHILGGLDRPSGGQVLFQDEEIFAKTDRGLADYRSKAVGFVFQFHHLLPEFSAQENIALAMMIAGEGREGAMQKALTILEDVGLSDRASHKPGELSGGEQQRVAIARALINDPQVLLADEPTGNLDSETGEDIYRILMREKEKRAMSLVMVTHNEELSNRADRKIRLKDGIIKYE